MQATDDAKKLSKLVLRGYKSIVNCDLELQSLNILIGANGSGKSNLLSLFQMIPAMLEKRFQTYVNKHGGPDVLLHCGRKKTDRLEIELYFGNNGYGCQLEPTQDNRLIFAEENFIWNVTGPKSLGRGHSESRIAEGTDTNIDHFVKQAMRAWRLYHFHDTSETAKVKGVHPINDYEYLRYDASNLAAFLNFLKKKHVKEYQKMVDTIRMVAPFFGDFCLRPLLGNSDQIQLEWFQAGEDVPFSAAQLSDGTLRFICLATVLLQPEALMPETIIIDEPELGLHPYAILVLSSLIQSIAQTKQVIIATQSVELLDQFNPENVIVANVKDGGTQLERLTQEKLAPWLEDYSLGELWKKNIFGGRPSK